MSSNSILLITGGNTGLGFETVKALCQSSKAYTILLGGRSLEKARAAADQAKTEFPQSPSVITPIQIDIEDDKSITDAFNHVESQYSRLDVLINNAGAVFDAWVMEGGRAMREMWNQSWNVNVSGTHVMTHTFIPLLLKSSNPRLLFITSGTSTLTECGDQGIFVNRSPPKGWPKQGPSVTAYRSSKAGLNMVMREWARILKDDGIKIWAISPGFLATGLGGDQERNKKMGAEDPALGGKFIQEVVEGSRDEHVGLAIRRNEVQPW